MRNLKDARSFPSVLGVRSRSTLRVAPDVRTPERHPAVRRAGEGSGERRPDPAGTPRGRLEPRRPAAPHAPRHADRPRGAGPLAAHAAAGRTRPPAVPRPVQLQPAETAPDGGPGRGERPRSAIRETRGHGGRVPEGRPRPSGAEGGRVARPNRAGPRHRGDRASRDPYGPRRLWP